MSEENEIREWPGYTGCFSREHARGAIPNGTRVAAKVGHAMGIVLGSVNGRTVDKELCDRKGVRFAYWIEWDQTPKQAHFVTDIRLNGAHADAVVKAPAVAD